MQKRHFSKKYLGLIFSVALLIVLVVALMLFNVFFSNQLQKTTEITAVASNQGVLVQQISKDLLVVFSQYQKVLPYDIEKERLQLAMDLFNSTLSAFENGGELAIPVEQADGQRLIRRVQVTKISNPVMSETIDKAKSIWDGYLLNVYPIFQTLENKDVELLKAIEFAQINSVPLTQLMNTLGEEVQAKAEQDIKLLRVLQIIGIVLAVLMFLFTVFYTVRNLQKTDRALDIARQETTDILENVQEGLFLIDENLIISNQYSKELELIFEQDHIGQRHFIDLIKQCLPPAMADTAEEFIKLLFDPHVVADLVEDLNPLEEVKASITRIDGGVFEKYLSFDFYQVQESDEIYSILVSIRDVTKEIALREELKNTQEKNKNQIDMLISLLHTPPHLLNNFLLGARQTLDNINKILKGDVSSDRDFKEKVDHIFIAIHRLKGEAVSMDFDAFADKAHEFEGEVDGLKKIEYIEGMDFLQLTILLDKLMSYTDALYQLAQRLNDYGRDKGEENIGFYQEKQEEGTVLKPSMHWDHLMHLVEKVAKDIGKQARLSVNNISGIDKSHNYYDVINSISIQLVRNAVVHGIEDGFTRKARSKAEVGMITMSLAEIDGGGVRIVIRDDGQGLSVEKIKEKLMEKSIYSSVDVNALSKEDIIKSAFLTGFSTADNVDMHSGRGVGLDVLLSYVKSLGAKIKLRQKANVFCEFEIVIPPNAVA